MMMKRTALSILFASSMTFVACGGRSGSDSDNNFNPRDTVNVPEGITGLDSINYIEDAIVQSPISANDLLGLAEVHWVENSLFYYNNTEYAEEYPEYAEQFLVSPRDSAVVRLANRLMRMAQVVEMNGNANDKLQWSIAVNAALDTFYVAVPSLPKDSAFNEINRVIEKFSSLTQSEMNYHSYIEATIDDYRTIDAYRQWLEAVPSGIKSLCQEEYEAWHDFNEARFVFWSDVSYTQEWYSMKPLEIHAYSEYLSSNRRAELEIEREIILENKPYQQKGKTVTAKQWEQWIADNSVQEEDYLNEMDDAERMARDSIITNRVNTLKSTFTRWLNARQAVVAALPEEQGKSYDNLTADMHSRYVGQLASLIPCESY